MARLRLSEAETEELYISGSSTFSTAVVFRQQVVALEYEPDFTVAQYGTLRLAHGAYGDAVQQVLSAGGRVQAAERIPARSTSRSPMYP